MMQYHIEHSVDPHFETPLVPYKPTGPYELRTNRVPAHFYRKRIPTRSYGNPMEHSHFLRQQTRPQDDVYRLRKVDTDTLKQLPEADRLLIESHLTPSMRHQLLSQMETGKFDTMLFQDRFGLPSFDLITSTIEKIGAGAGKYIGGKLAGEIGARLGASAGAYLGLAAANRLTKKKEDTTKKPEEAPSKPGNKYGYGGSYGAMLLKS